MNWLRSFWKLLTDNSYSIKRASTLLAISAILSNVLGLARNLLFYRFVSPAQLDIYFASFRIPDFLFNLVIFGAVSSAFVPMVSDLLAKKDTDRAHELTDQLLTWLTIFFLIIALVLGLAMRPVMHLVVHGFNQDRFEQAVLISRILLMQSLFFAWSFTLGGFLNSVKRFSSYAFAPLIYNVAIIIGAILARHYGIIAITYSVVVGAFLHFAIQYREVLKTAYRPRLDFRFTDQVRTVIRLMIPRSLSQSMSQLAVVVYTSLASGLQYGSIAIFSGMNDLQTMPIQVTANAIGVAFFPTLSASIAREDWNETNALISKVFRALLFLLIPAVVFAFIIRAQLVRLYFGIGSANWQLTTLAIHTFVGFLVGIIPSAFVVILSKVFYASKNTRTPMILSAISIAVGLTYAYLGIHWGGTVAQLALADSILSLTQCGLYMYVISRHSEIRLGILAMKEKIISYAFGAVLLGAATWLSLYLTGKLSFALGYDGSHNVVFTLLSQLVIATAVGAVVFLQYSKAVHKEELQWIIKRNFSSEN